MARFEYMMVYAPRWNEDSFLLYVIDEAGHSRLRSYARGRPEDIGAPSYAEVLSEAKVGGIPIQHCEPHRLKGDNYWYQRTLELNKRYLKRPAKDSLAGETE